MGPDPGAAAKATRDVCFSPDGSYVTATVYDGDVLRPGMVVEGPAVVERTTTTVVVGPRETLAVNDFGTLSVVLAR